MRLAWATDIHLNFLDPAALQTFFEAIVAARADALILSGDIAEASSIEAHLLALERVVAVPIYFVLGNHDYYGGSISEVRARVATLCRPRGRLRYLTQTGVVPLSAETALIGHDGWADGRFGDYAGSKVLLNDYVQIRDLCGLDAVTRLSMMQRLASEAAAHFHTTLPEALSRFRQVIVATHVPPFREACWHEGEISGSQWLPHFSSRIAGEAILEAAQAWPHRRIRVLCGHTHGSGVTQPRPNVEVHTGGAAYGAPALQTTIEIGSAYNDAR
jgi:predicted MPP superfamily phosphohydrolase